MSQSSPLHRQDGAQSHIPNIILLSIAGYGQLQFPDNSLEISVKPSTYDPGGLDAISTALVARATAKNLDELEALALTGHCYVQLTWRLHLPYPSFTTRHLLVTSETLVSFSGDLVWAQRIVKNAENFQIIDRPLPSSVPTQMVPVLPPVTARDRQKTASLTSHAGIHSQLQLERWAPSSMGTQPYSPAEIPDTPLSMSPAREDDQLSVCSDLTAAGTPGPSLHHNQNFRLLSPPPSRKQSSHIEDVNYEWVDRMVQQQLQLDMFHQRKREAEELYARNGDTSGLLAVLAAVTDLPKECQSQQYPYS